MAALMTSTPTKVLRLCVDPEMNEYYQNKMKEIIPVAEALADKVEQYEAGIKTLQEKQLNKRKETQRPLRLLLSN